MRDGGMLLALNPSASVDQESEGVVTLANVGRATRKLISGEVPLGRDTQTYLLPVAMHYEPGDPSSAFFKIVTGPKAVTDPQEVHHAMHLLAETLDEGVEGKTYVYDENPDD